MSGQPKLDAASIREASVEIKAGGFTVDCFLTPIAPCDHEALNLFRQWFDAVQDLNPLYLKVDDYRQARLIYEKLGMRVPHSILEGCK
jgi:hypothetical protein